MVDSSIHRKIQELLIENDFVTLAEYLEEAEATTKHEARFLAHMSIVLQQNRNTVLNIQVSLKQFMFQNAFYQVKRFKLVSLKSASF